MIARGVAHELMRAALDEARRALEHDDVPVGAVIAQVDASGAATVVAAAHNRREIDQDPTAHAEVLALRNAAQTLGRWRLDDCVLVVTLEPCVMCAGALSLARIGAVVFGAADAKGGACGSLYHVASDPRLNHNFEVTGDVGAAEASAMLTEFFGRRRGTGSP